MRLMVSILLLPLWLLTCGPAQDKSAVPDAEAVERSETLFNQAYQDLDVAIVDRLLSENFEAAYPDRATTKNKQQWLAELQGLRNLFPALEISVDSLTVAIEEQGATVRAVRTFAWTQDGQSGTYRERYINQWSWQSGKWQLDQSTLTQP